MNKSKGIIAVVIMGAFLTGCTVAPQQTIALSGGNGF